MKRFGHKPGGIEQQIDLLLEHFASKESVITLTDKVNALEIENLILRKEMQTMKEGYDRRIDLIDCAVRSNNLIFTGLEQKDNIAPSLLVSAFTTKVLGVASTPIVAEVFPLGSGPRVPIVAKFEKKSDVVSILKSTNRLKGIMYGVNRDFPA